MADNQPDPDLPGDDGQQFDPANGAEGQTGVPTPPTSEISQSDDPDDEEEEEIEQVKPRVFQLLEILLIFISVWTIFWCVLVVLPIKPSTHPGTSPGGLRPQESIWEKITNPGRHAWSDYWFLESNTTVESVSYDLVKDRYLRYVTKAKIMSNGHVSQSPVVAHTYVWQEAGEVTSTMPVPSSSFPEHSAKAILEALKPKIVNAMSDVRVSLSKVTDAFKEPDIPPFPKVAKYEGKQNDGPKETGDGTNSRDIEAAKYVSYHAKKILEEIKSLESSVAKVAARPHQHSMLMRHFTIEDINRYVAHVDERLANLADHLGNDGDLSLGDNVARDIYSRKDLENLKVLIAGKLQRISEILMIATIVSEVSDSETSPSISPFVTQSKKAGLTLSDIRSPESIVKETISSVGNLLVPSTRSEIETTSPSSSTASKTGKGLSNEDFSSSKTGLADQIRSFRDALKSSAVSSRPLVTPITKLKQPDASQLQAASKLATPMVEVKESKITTSRKGAWEKWWSTQRLKGPPMTMSSNMAEQNGPQSMVEPVTMPALEQPAVIEEERKPYSERLSAQNGATPATPQSKFMDALKADQHQKIASHFTVPEDQVKLDTESKERSSKMSTQKSEQGTDKPTILTIRYVEVQAQTSARVFPLTQSKTDFEDKKSQQVKTPFNSRLSQKDLEKQNMKSKILTATIKVNDIGKTVPVSKGSKASVSRFNSFQGKADSALKYLSPVTKTIEVPVDFEREDLDYASSATAEVDKPQEDSTMSLAAKSSNRVSTNSVNEASNNISRPAAAIPDVSDTSTSGYESAASNSLKGPTKTVPKSPEVPLPESPITFARQIWKDLLTSKSRREEQEDKVIREKEADRIPSFAPLNTSRRTTVKSQSPEGNNHSERFFNSPAYQDRSPRDRAEDDILDVSESLFSVIDKLMAEGNKHFAHITRLQAAWDGLTRANSVMGQSALMTSMARDRQGRDLLTSYAGVVHKFDRLVSIFTTATARMASSAIVTEVEVKQWRSQMSDFNSYTKEISKRPLFVDQFVTVSEGFHWDILVDARSKIHSVRASLSKLRASSTV